MFSVSKQKLSLSLVPALLLVSTSLALRKMKDMEHLMENGLQIHFPISVCDQVSMSDPVKMPLWIPLSSTAPAGDGLCHFPVSQWSSQSFSAAVGLKISAEFYLGLHINRLAR